MNREIKFCICSGDEFEYISIQDILNNNNAILQFTGFKDKNNKDIYESDHVKGFLNISQGPTLPSPIHIEGVVKFHQPTGQFLVRYTLANGLETTIALNGIYDLELVN